MKTIFGYARQKFPPPGGRMIILAAILVCIGSIPALGQGDRPDIDLRIVGMLNLQPPLPDEGDDVQLGVLVENRGVKDAQDVVVYFYEDDVHFDKETVDIRAGDTVYLETVWTADSGDSYLSVTVDPGGDFSEDRRDNSVGVWVTVR
jgi:hypothetical protein